MHRIKHRLRSGATQTYNAISKLLNENRTTMKREERGRINQGVANFKISN